MKKFILLCLSITLLSGCVSTKNMPIAESALENMREKEITTTTRTKPPFSAMTAGKAAFGMLGAAAMISAGNKIVLENNVDDPASYIADELLAALVHSYELKVQDSDELILTSEKVPAIAEQYHNSPYLLDVRTINWSFGYFPMDWNSYRVIYSAKLRLIDIKSKKIISEGFCSRVPEKTNGAPSKEQLLGNKAEGLKAELKIAANFCINEFKQKTLSL